MVICSKSKYTSVISSDAFGTIVVIRRPLIKIKSILEDFRAKKRAALNTFL
jgi:hypothetical protein